MTTSRSGITTTASKAIIRLNILEIKSIKEIARLEREAIIKGKEFKGTTIGEVHENLYDRGFRRSYTTFMTAMNRLAEKGALGQDKSSVPYVYTLSFKIEEYGFSGIDLIIDSLFDGDPDAVIKYLQKKKTQIND